MRCQETAKRKIVGQMAGGGLSPTQNRGGNTLTERSTTSQLKHCPAMDVSKNICLTGEEQTLTNVHTAER